MVKDYLTSKNISYQNIDVSIDSNAAQEMVEVSGQMGVPVIIIDGQVSVGFDKARLESLLGK
jgi:glutaredoxin